MASLYLIPFGKHKGRPLHQVPQDYLRWVDSNLTLNPWFRAAVARAISGHPVYAPTEFDRIDAHKQATLNRFRVKGVGHA